MHMYTCMHMITYMFMHEGYAYQCMCMHTSSQPGRSPPVSCQPARSDAPCRKGLLRALPLLLPASAMLRSPALVAALPQRRAQWSG